MKKLIISFLSLSLSLKAYSQSAFTFDLKKDLILGSFALTVFTIPFFIANEPPNIPVEVNKEDVNRFDRILMFPYNKTLDKISDYGVYGLLLLPAISLIGNARDKNAWLTYGIMYSQAFFLTFGTKDLLKDVTNRYRPYVYLSDVPDGLMNDFHNSFPSGSTALAFLSASFLSATFSIEYPNSPWKVPVIIGSYTLATSVAALRIYSGSHFLTDVIAGAVIGSIYGWIIPMLHIRKDASNNLALNFTGNGIIMSLRY
jgi:membrane-associated phospholipid phosphatase